MSVSLLLDRNDILRVVQSIGRSIRGAAIRQDDSASLFREIVRSDEFSPAQRVTLAELATLFFDLNQNPAEAERLRALLPGLGPLEAWADELFAAWGKKSICFRSSGSTGEPRANSISLPLLEDELEAVVQAFPGRGRIVSVMPVHHIFGMMYGPLLSRYLALPLELAPPLPVASFFQTLRPGDLVVAFPFFWQSLLHMVLNPGKDRSLRFPENIAGLTATSPCPPKVIRGLLGLFPSNGSASLAAMTEIYGSSETNGIGMRRNACEWYELFSVWEPAALPDNSRGIRRRKPRDGQQTPFAMPDVITWHDERHFRPERRVDNAVQVGGVNVYPERVADVIRTHPLVKECAVRLMRPEEGVRLKAFIVPRIPLEEASASFGKEFRMWLAARLETAWRPKLITLGTQLPVNCMGKASDW